VKLIDAHAHLQFPQFDADRTEVIARAREAEIGVVNVGTDLNTSQAAITLAEQNENMWATVGIHPTDSPKAEKFEQTFVDLKKLARNPKVVGIGECGLDYFHIKDEKERKRQQEIFGRQIELSKIVSKPLMIHCRQAYDELLSILNSQLLLPSLNIHFFAGDWPIACKFLDFGGTLSFTGVITFTNDYDEVLKNTPLDRIMIETDCPFVAPVPYRGKRNEPSYLGPIVERLAEIKGLPVGSVAQATLVNTQRFFGLALS